MRLDGTDEDVAWEERLEVDERKGMGRCEKDLDEEDVCEKKWILSAFETFI